MACAPRFGCTVGLEWIATSLILTSGLLLWYERRLAFQVAELAAQLERTAALKADLRWWRESLRRLAEWQEVTESGIDGGTRAVRAVHQGIAAIPFEILDAIPATRDTSRVVRNIHDFAADNVYAAISAVNQLLGSGSRRLIEGRRRPALKAEPERSRVDDPERSDR